MQARTCYGHLAGALGVWLYDRLVALDAIEPAGEIRGDVALGLQAKRWLPALGVDAATALKSKRRFAFACLDWTERRPHLGGALGAQIGAHALAEGWAARIPGTRAVRFSTAGREHLALLGPLPVPPSVRSSQ